MEIENKSITQSPCTKSSSTLLRPRHVSNCSCLQWRLRTQTQTHTHTTAGLFRLCGAPCSIVRVAGECDQTNGRRQRGDGGKETNLDVCPLRPCVQTSSIHSQLGAMRRTTFHHPQHHPLHLIIIEHPSSTTITSMQLTM